MGSKQHHGSSSSSKWRAEVRTAPAAGAALQDQRVAPMASSLALLLLRAVCILRMAGRGMGLGVGYPEDAILDAYC